VLGDPDRQAKLAKERYEYVKGRVSWTATAQIVKDAVLAAGPNAAATTALGGT